MLGCNDMMQGSTFIKMKSNVKISRDVKYNFDGKSIENEGSVMICENVRHYGRIINDGCPAQIFCVSDWSVGWWVVPCLVSGGLPGRPDWPHHPACLVATMPSSVEVVMAPVFLL